jgi:hypothetical protein
MRSQLAIESEPQAPVQVLSGSLGARVVGTLVPAAAGGLMSWLAVAQPARGHEIGFLFALVMFWWAACTATTPRVKATLDADGLEFVDYRWAFLFRTPRCRVPWRDLLEIASRTVASRYGSYIRTRIKVRVCEVPERTRWFPVTNRNPGYYAFLAALNARIDAARVPVGGLGIEPGAVRGEAQRILRSQLKLVLIFAALGIAAMILAYFTRR